MEENKKKYYFIIGIVTILLFIVGASYAYFAVSTTNNFGTHTISGTMEDVGSVALTSTGNNISLNLSAADMMADKTGWYYGTVDGTPTRNRNYGMIKLADAIVTGSGYYDCYYTMQITATGTNNMYTTFQGVSWKEYELIRFLIGDYDYLLAHSINGSSFDFIRQNLFPITYNGKLTRILAESPKGIYGELNVKNSASINQTELAGTDITMSATVTSFTCTALQTSYAYWNSNYDNNRYSDNTTLVNNNYPYYIKTLVAGSSDVSNEVCGVFNGTEVCIKPNDWGNASTYKSQMEAAGATCNLTDSELNCSASAGSVLCGMSSYGDAGCRIGDYACGIDNSGNARCYIRQ